MRHLFLVSEQHGGPWDWSRGLREQAGFDEHARFMDALVDEGFVVRGGPLDERDVLLVVASDSEPSIRARLAPDPWIEERHALDHIDPPLDGPPYGAAR